MADLVRLTIEQRAAFGNWRDLPKELGRSKEPMAVRYSDARLLSSLQVKQICVAAFIFNGKTHKRSLLGGVEA